MLEHMIGCFFFGRVFVQQKVQRRRRSDIRFIADSVIVGSVGKLAIVGQKSHELDLFREVFVVDLL